MEIILRKIIFFSFVQIAVATARHRYNDKQDPGKMFKMYFLLCSNTILYDNL